MFSSRPAKRLLCAVSVDLDEISNYLDIHGLDTAAGPPTAVYDIAIDRLVQLAKDARMPLTLFAVGRDLKRPEAAAKLRACSEGGHEIGNHSFDHRYDFSKLDFREMQS